jgi:DNA transformation protein and related proteins
MNDSFLEYIKEQFSFLGFITIRKMFGGAGIYFEGTMFGLVADDTIYLKVNENNKAKFEEIGMGPFTYDGKKGKPIKMSYYQLPEDILEDTEELRQWAEDSVLASKK